MLLFGHLGITLAFVFLVFLILKENVDYRYVLAGSMLPDIIDKPVGHILFPEIFHNGRIFCHTLLFIVVLIILAVYMERHYKYTGVSFLGLGAMMHLIEDQMWFAPQTLFWPLFGLEFPQFEYGSIVGYWLNGLLTEPQAYIPEIIGITILAAFIYHYRIYEPARLKSFVVTGTVAASSRGAASPTE